MSRALGHALRLLARDPQAGSRVAAALALFCVTVLAVHRRQHAMALIDG